MRPRALRCRTASCAGGRPAPRALGTIGTGAKATGETQRVTISSPNGGSFTLSLTDNGKTYTTKALLIGASALDVQNALNQALSVGLVTVTASGNSYDITFTGGLAGKNIANLVVTLTAAGSNAALTLTQTGGTAKALAGTLEIFHGTLTDGRAPTGETQRVTIDAGARRPLL